MTVVTPSREAASLACPKRMQHGPCGGVHSDGACEVAGLRCGFVDLGAVLSASGFDLAEVAPPSADALRDLRGEQGGRSPAGSEFAALVAQGGILTADLPLRTTDPAEFVDLAAMLTGLTAVVAGEPPGLDASLSPSHKALLLQRAGVRVIAGLTCRDRNRVALEGELAALADIGVAGVLAVTGDHPDTTARPDAEAVFDLDSTRLAALVRRAGLFTAVAEQPAAPPRSFRPERLGLKVRAGAELCFLNLCGGAHEVAAFASAARGLGVDIPLIASVPVIASAEGAARLMRLPGVTLPEGFAPGILAGRDLEARAVEAAADLAVAMLAVPGVAGVHLSAVGGPADDAGRATAQLVMRAAARVRERVPAPTTQGRSAGAR